jgi:hypothetical protein
VKEDLTGYPNWSSNIDLGLPHSGPTDGGPSSLLLAGEEGGPLFYCPRSFLIEHVFQNAAVTSFP